MLFRANIAPRTYTHRSPSVRRCVRDGYLTSNRSRFNPARIPKFPVFCRGQNMYLAVVVDTRRRRYRSLINYAVPTDRFSRSK